MVTLLAPADVILAPRPLRPDVQGVREASIVIKSSVCYPGYCFVRGLFASFCSDKIRCSSSISALGAVTFGLWLASNS